MIYYPQFFTFLFRCSSAIASIVPYHPSIHSFSVDTVTLLQLLHSHKLVFILLELSETRYYYRHLRLVRIVILQPLESNRQPHLDSVAYCSLSQTKHHTDPLAIRLKQEGKEENTEEVLAALTYLVRTAFLSFSAWVGFVSRETGIQLLSGRKYKTLSLTLFTDILRSSFAYTLCI